MARTVSREAWSAPTPEEQPRVSSNKLTSSLPTISGDLNGVQHIRTHVDVRSLEDHLSDINQSLLLGGDNALDLLRPGVSYAFNYKGRGCRGGPLACAVQCKEGLEVAKQLVALRANVNEECWYKSLGTEATAQPIHLAVQSGLPSMLEVLIDAGASIDARATRGGKDHFYPLHEAAFFRSDAMAAFLLEQGAKVNCSNLDGMTPLHVAAKNGAASVVAELLKYSANIEVADDLGRSALQVAVESGVFPHRRLFLLARWQIEDIMAVADHCPSALPCFMHDLCWENDMPIQEVHKSSMVARLLKTQDVQCSHWIDLMDVAPEGGCLLFDILTVEPDEDNFFYHPLPAQAFVRDLQCSYQQDKTWSCETETGAPRWPDWHNQLAPSCDIQKRLQRRRTRATTRASQSARIEMAKGIPREMGDIASKISGSLKDIGLGAAELTPVHIRHLRLQGVLCPEVFQALANTSHLAIFEREATQSILQYTWVTFVRDYYTAQLCHRTLEIAVLVLWTFYFHPEYSVDDWWFVWVKRMCWSFVLVSSLRETVREFSQAVGHIARGDHHAYFGNYWNYLDWATILMFNLFSWTSMSSLELNTDPRIYAAVSLFRWLQLLYTLRAYSMGKLGLRSIIPILHSLKEMGGMLIICAFTFVGFTHAFLALDQNPNNWQAVVVDTFRLLFMADGDGIDTILTLGVYESSQEITVAFGFLCLATIVFCISLLNLFIAVHGEAYAQANRNSMALHLQERAGVCLHAMMQLQWPPPEPIRRRLGPFGRRFERPRVAYLILCAVTVPTWLALLYLLDLHPAFTSFIILLFVLLGNSLLVQRPWKDEQERANCMIWWCAPASDSSWQEEVQRARGIESEDIMKRFSFLEGRTDDISKDLAQLDQKLEALLTLKTGQQPSHGRISQVAQS